ncbi:MAG: type II secretion system protein N [Pseudomonadota bacterium]
MKLRLVWLGLATFLVALITVLPVRWVAWLLPANVQCTAWSGSVWRGQCIGLTVQHGSATQIQMLRWTLHPAALLRRTVNADFSVRTEQGTGSGVAELDRNGLMAVDNLAINAVLDRRLATMLAEGWNGQLQARNLTVRMQGNTLQALSGEIALRDFLDGQGTSLGNYRLVFPRAAAAPFAGALSDMGGPLEVRASVTVSADRRWQLDGTVAPRPEASQSLRSRLDILGAPDAAGRYRLLSEGTFR